MRPASIACSVGASSTRAMAIRRCRVSQGGPRGVDRIPSPTFAPSRASPSTLRRRRRPAYHAAAYPPLPIIKRISKGGDVPILTPKIMPPPHSSRPSRCVWSRRHRWHRRTPRARARRAGLGSDPRCLALRLSQPWADGEVAAWPAAAKTSRSSAEEVAWYGCVHQRRHIHRPSVTTKQVRIWGNTCQCANRRMVQSHSCK